MLCYSSPINLAKVVKADATEFSRRPSINSFCRRSPSLSHILLCRLSTNAMSLKANDSSTDILSSARPAGISHSFVASPSAFGSAQVISNDDPNHQRTLSFSEIYEELEQEQEAQVNCMMRMIRNQQLYLNQIRMQYESGSRQNLQHTSITAVPDDLHDTEAYNIPQSNVISSESASYLLTSPARPSCPATSRSRTSGTSTHGTCANDFPPSPLLSHRDSSYLADTRRGSWSINDEPVYYEAEAVWLARENQILRMRVRNLEKQIAERELAATGSGLKGLSAETLEIPSPLLDAMHTR
jgi:hypothetical protein